MVMEMTEGFMMVEGTLGTLEMVIQEIPVDTSGIMNLTTGTPTGKDMSLIRVCLIFLCILPVTVVGLRKLLLIEITEMKV